MSVKLETTPIDEPLMRRNVFDISFQKAFADLADITTTQRSRLDRRLWWISLPCAIGGGIIATTALVVVSKTTDAVDVNILTSMLAWGAGYAAAGGAAFGLSGAWGYARDLATIRKPVLVVTKELGRGLPTDILPAEVGDAAKTIKCMAKRYQALKPC